jgi:uncharacterized Zn finger protein (UPF0148 family)
MAALKCPKCGTYFKRKFGGILVDGTVVCINCKVLELGKILIQETKKVD